MASWMMDTRKHISFIKVCRWLSAINQEELEIENSNSKRSYHNTWDVLFTQDEIRNLYATGNLDLLTEMHPGIIRLKTLVKRMIKLQTFDTYFELHAESYTQTFRTNDDVKKDKKFLNPFTMFRSVQANRPHDGDIVWLHYAAYDEGCLEPFCDSLSLDSTAKGQPYKLEVGSEIEDKGLSMAVKWLPVGARGRFVFPESEILDKNTDGRRSHRPGSKVLLLLHTLYYMEMHKCLCHLRNDGRYY